MSTDRTTSAGAAQAVPADTACRAVVLGERCTEPGIYRTLLVDCSACRNQLGALFCKGHTFCVLHAAEVRTGEREFDYEDEAVRVVVARMTAVVGAS